MRSCFDYSNLYPMMKAFADEQQWKGFTLKRYRFNSIRSMIAWWIRDKSMAECLGIDLSKGLMITGSQNIGKTTLMTMLREIRIDEKAKLKPYTMVNCANLSDQYALKGRQALLPVIHTSCCFDGLGKEMLTGHYSQPFELMRKVLIACAEDHVSSGLITHVTTSLSAREIEDRYGQEIRVKMRNMFNQVLLDR